MTITAPTATSLKMRFPEFSDVSDGAVEFAIEEARLEVGNNWTSKADLAVLYLAAHLVSCGIAASAAGGSGEDAEIASESIGRLSVTYARSPNADASVDDRESTSYGRRFLQLQSRNFSGPVLI